MPKNNNTNKREKKSNKFATQSLKDQWDKEEPDKTKNKNNSVTNFDHSLNIFTDI